MKLPFVLMSTSLLFSWSVFAQNNPAAEPQGQATGMSPAHNPAMMQKMRNMMFQRHTQHLEALKANLKLQPEQEGIWNAFVSSMKPTGPHPSKESMQNMDQLTTPERIDKMMAFKAQRDAELQKRSEATKALYAVLSLDQQKTFDQHTAKFMHKIAKMPLGPHQHMSPLN